MAKLVFPGVGSPYRGFIGEVRGWFNRIASYVEKSPGAISAVNSQIDVLATELGLVPTLPGMKAIVSDGDSIPANDDYSVTVYVTAGIVTAVVTGP